MRDELKKTCEVLERSLQDDFWDEMDNMGDQDVQERMDTLIIATKNAITFIGSFLDPTKVAQAAGNYINAMPGQLSGEALTGILVSLLVSKTKSPFEAVRIVASALDMIVQIEASTSECMCENCVAERKAKSH